MNSILESKLGREIFLLSEDDRKQFSIAGKIPAIVITPQNIEQIVTVFKLALKEKKKIIICGNNSQSDFGGFIDDVEWIISTKNLTAIIDHDVSDLTITVAAGMTFYGLQHHLKSHNQFLPIDPIPNNNRSIGGIVAANSAGPLRFRHGYLRDLVLGMKVVLPDGTIIKTGGKTVKNVAGYNLSKIFIGSMGTLGLISEITFKLSPLPVNSSTLLFCHDEMNSIHDMVKILISSNMIINRCELVNSHYLEMTGINQIVPECQHHLFINLADHHAANENAMTRILKFASEFGLTYVHTFPNNESENLWHKFINDLPVDQLLFITEIAVPRKNTFSIINFINELTAKYQVNKSLQSHIGNGFINLYIAQNDEHGKNIHLLQKIIIEIRNQAEKLDGYLIVKQAPVENRSYEFTWGTQNRNLDIMKNIKHEYDPENVLVAGRFIGGL